MNPSSIPRPDAQPRPPTRTEDARPARIASRIPDAAYARLGRTDTRASDGCSRPAGWLGLLLLFAVLAAHPHVALAGSPFATGANATQQQLVAILTPLAAVAVMVSGAMAWFGRLSWWWMVAVVIGTVLVFGGPQIVSWIRGLFGV